jgi:hypothetical protein
MPDITTPLEMGFAEFTAQLISEVFEAIATSQVDQELRRADMSALAAMPPQEYAVQFIHDRQVETELVRLFPAVQSRQKHAIYAGAAYQPQREDRNEIPAIGKHLGITLGSEHLQSTKRGKLTLTQAGVETIQESARLRLAEGHLRALQQLLSQGIPRVLVDSGHINAKLTFQLIRVQDAARPENASRMAEPLKPLGEMGKLALPGSLKDIRLIVRPTDDRTPQTSNVQANVYGEVDITFKTVT